MYNKVVFVIHLIQYLEKTLKHREKMETVLTIVPPCCPFYFLPFFSFFKLNFSGMSTDSKVYSPFDMVFKQKQA